MNLAHSLFRRGCTSGGRVGDVIGDTLSVRWMLKPVVECLPSSGSLLPCDRHSQRGAVRHARVSRAIRTVGGGRVPVPVAAKWARTSRYRPDSAPCPAG